MFKHALRYLFLLTGMSFVLSCSNTNNKPDIMFDSDSSSIIIKKIDAASLLQIKNTWNADPDKGKLITVVLVPGTDDSLQVEKVLSGTTVLKGDVIVFTPERPFEKGENYQVESYIGIDFANAGKLFTGGIKHKLQPQQQILTR